MNHRRKYTTEQKVSATLRIILILVVAFAVYAIADAYAVKSWDVEYPMTNARIEWTGAGYSGWLGGDR